MPLKRCGCCDSSSTDAGSLLLAKEVVLCVLFCALLCLSVLVFVSVRVLDLLVVGSSGAVPVVILVVNVLIRSNKLFTQTRVCRPWRVLG